ANVALGMDGLRRALDEGTCVMVALPGRKGCGRTGIPVSREGGTLVLRTGGGREERWDEEAFEASWGGRGMVLIEASGAKRRLPEGREERLALGEYWLGTGETGRAAAAFGSAADGDGPGDARGTLGAGTAAAREGRWEEASARFETALALEPKNARAMNNAAYARVKTGERLDEALALAQAAVAAHPGNPVYLETLAAALLARDDGRAEEAAKCLERAWARAAKLPAQERIAILAQLERAWLAAGRPDLASQVRAAREREAAASR
ncbi:MAG: hypothetical protein IK066_04665, partial [Kiritimatiellae bacterium]|nr:hypothetical protein [Kiritimatiellia bacterium]